MSRPSPTTVLGWNIGGTTSSALLGTADGKIIARREWSSHVELGCEAMIARFLDVARELTDQGEAIAGLGVSIGGPMNPLTGEILSPPHLPGWDAVPLATRLHEALTLDVVVEHDANACLQAEWLWGGAAGCTHAAYLTCGTGFGAGLMVDGRIVRGPGGQTVEIGHVRLADDGPVMFGKAGSAESFCGGTGIARLAAWMFPESFPQPTPTPTLKQRADDGDEHAAAVLAEAARRTGQFCALLGDLHCPQVILLGSLGRYLGPEWVEQIRQAFRDEVLASRQAIRIEPAALAAQLQDYSPLASWVWRRQRVSQST
jgi:glucokinase